MELTVWAICRMFDTNNRVRRALKPPYVGHIKFISIILLVWSPMIAFITFIEVTEWIWIYGQWYGW